MREFWNERYAAQTVAHEIGPNRFFRRFIHNSKPGSMLLPAANDGKNAVYAATKGWEVDAFDSSEEVREKAMQLAYENSVHINYELDDLRKFKANKQYDAVGLFYIQMSERTRQHFHREACKSLKSGGILILEAFAKEQIHNNTGGPKDISLLYDAPAICEDFQHLYMLHCSQKEILISDKETSLRSDIHLGRLSVLRFIAQKL